MRVHLETWLIGDGQIPEFTTGDVLSGISLWFTAHERTASSGSDVVGPWDESGARITSELDGTVEWLRRDPDLALVRTGDVLMFLEGEWKQVGDRRDGEVEPSSLRLPPVGFRTRVTGSLSVAAEHLLEDVPPEVLARPDVSADWAVRQIEFNYSRTGRTELFDRADRTGDGRGGAYVIDIERA